MMTNAASLASLHQLSVRIETIELVPSSVPNSWFKFSFFCELVSDTGQAARQSQLVTECWSPENFTILVRVNSVVRVCLIRKKSALLPLKHHKFCENQFYLKPLLLEHSGKLDGVQLTLALNSTASNNPNGSLGSDKEEVAILKLALSGLKLSEDIFSNLLDSSDKISVDDSVFSSDCSINGN